ncbi:hypothetical protein ACI2KC_17955 [Pseudomonas monteilii]|uniref:hypothetical protein n=1 Tax=Pseudomonas alabamensis TaxID=3064349 RepID=UPI0038535057
MKGIEVKILPGLLVQLHRLGAPAPTEISIVPGNISSANNKQELTQSSESDTIRTLLTQNLIAHKDLFDDEGEIEYIQNYSDDWFGPCILIPIAATIQNPNVTSIILGLITNYIYDAFKGSKGQSASLSIIKETANGEFRSISYNGPVEGLSELAEILKNAE